MIYDTFPFFDELGLLELRLHELTGVVDRFVLVEATRTHSNKPKPLYFHEKREAFKPFLDKIIHVVVDDLPDSRDTFVLDDFQKDCVTRGMTGCKPDDLILLSDADEIPRAESVRTAARAMRFDSRPAAAAWHRLLKNRAVIWTFRNWFKKRHPFVTVFEQRYHAFFLNCARAREVHWLGTRMVHFRDFTTATHLRRWKGARMPNAGWHFTYMGGVKAVQAKLSASAHQEYNTPEYTDTTRLGALLQQGKHFVEGGKPLHFEKVDESYPAYLRQNLGRFRDWIRETA